MVKQQFCLIQTVRALLASIVASVRGSYHPISVLDRSASNPPKLYGVSSLDAPTYGSVLLFAFAAATACTVMARRAAGIDPATVLRGS